MVQIKKKTMFRKPASETSYFLMQMMDKVKKRRMCHCVLNILYVNYPTIRPGTFVTFYSRR
jgi:hypothetical protein